MNQSNQSLRILITGGSGLIGSHLAERLVELGHDLIIVDDLSTGRRSNLDAIPKNRYKFIHSTLDEAMSICESLEPDRIYHLAAAVGVELILKQPIETIETNIFDTAHLLRMASRHKIPTLIASSSEVYGKSKCVPFAEDDDVVYGATSLTRWLYAGTKAIDEYLAEAHYRHHDLPVVVARLFNTVGPRQVGTYGMVLPRFVKAALSNEPLTVYGDGSQVRCFCDVRDVRNALIDMLEKPDCYGRVLNVGADKPISIRSLAETVIDVLGSSSTIRVISYEEAYEKGFEDLAVRQPDTTRIREAINFHPEIPLDQTIRDLADEISSRTG